MGEVIRLSGSILTFSHFHKMLLISALIDITGLYKVAYIFKISSDILEYISFSIGLSVLRFCTSLVVSSPLFSFV